uniref:Transmembrane protein 41B n=1 Tax=Plectus sambesii TaxID=2011161 RepID=A0A914WUG0_9BILA
MIERQKVLLLGGIFTTAISLLIALYLRFPELNPDERQHFKLPKNMEDAKQLGLVLSTYKEQHYYTVLGGILVVYILLQSFAIPGSIFLSILSGYLFSFPLALLLVCTCSAVGAVICYLLSYLIGRNLVTRYWPDRVRKWQIQISNHREHLLNYIIFLRVTPFLPNWFINIASPVIDVPLSPFFWGTFLGVAPPSFVFIQTGKTLEKMTSTDATWSWGSVALLAVFAVLSLLPVFFKKRLQSRLD